MIPAGVRNSDEAAITRKAEKSKGKKMAFERAACKFATTHFSAADFFACPSLTLETDYPHGWQGNTTDTLPMQNDDESPDFDPWYWLAIRG